MKLWWSLALVVVASSIIVVTARAESELWDESGDELLVRTVRDTKEKEASTGSTVSCKYMRAHWSKCNPKTNLRSRTMHLKSGDTSCQEVKTDYKECKGACRYEKGTWSTCVDQKLTRVDSLKPNSDTSCEKTRKITKKCKSNSKRTTKGARAKKKSDKQ